MMGDTSKIIRLLEDADEERRVAAARVLGAFGTKSAAPALVGLLTTGSPNERRACAIALGEIKAAKAIGPLVDTLLDPAPAVRMAAQAAVRMYGDKAVVPLQEKLDGTTADSERALLSTALASLGGASATGALLEGLRDATEDAARSAALRFRQEIKGASAAERREHRAVIEDYLDGESGGGAKIASKTSAAKKKSGAAKKKTGSAKGASKGRSPLEDVKENALAKDAQSADSVRDVVAAKLVHQHARAAAAKMLGFIEDPAALNRFVALAEDDTEPLAVRIEAVVGMRFALGTERKAPAVQNALLALLKGAPPTLLRAAMDTLQNLVLDDTATASLAELAQDAPRDVAQFAILALASLETKASFKALAHLVHHGQPIERAQAAAHALAGQAKAVPLMLDVLADRELLGGSTRVQLCADVLAKVDSFTKPQAKKFVALTIECIDEGRPGYEALVKVARDKDGEALADALRALVTSLRRRKKTEKAAAVLGLLERGDSATTDDRFRHAVLALGQSRKDTRPQARQRDPALKLFSDILDEGADLMRLLKKEKSVDDEARFYLGWHFIEEGHSVGEELLDDIIARKPRTKLARMAKNKKKLELEA